MATRGGRLRGAWGIALAWGVAWGAAGPEAAESSMASALARRGCLGEVHATRDRMPVFWDRTGEALRQAGIARPVAAMCARPSAAWSAWVLAERRPGERDVWAVVSWDGSAMRTLCVSTEDDGCRRYWAPRPR